MLGPLREIRFSRENHPNELQENSGSLPQCSKSLPQCFKKAASTSAIAGGSGDPGSGSPGPPILGSCWTYLNKCGVQEDKFFIQLFIQIGW